MKLQSGMPQNLKDPEEKLVFGWDWVDALESGESISTSEWTIETTETGSPPTALIITPGSESLSGTETGVRIEEGTRGVTYLLKNKITTAPSGDVGVRRIEIRIAKR